MVEEFEDDDAGFAAWVAVHPGGYVLNIQRSLNPVDARVHAAGCGHIARAIRQSEYGSRQVTHEYIKVCALSLAELDEWTEANGGMSIRQCAHCLPGNSGAVDSPTQTRRQEPRPIPPVPSAYEIRLVEGVVQLEGPRYIRFEETDPEALQARTQLRDQLRNLTAEAGTILHARYSGHRPTNADVENLLIYNIDEAGAAFQPSTGYGVRFEEFADSYSDVGVGRRCRYSYRLIQGDAPLGDWTVRDLARFTDAELGAFRSEHRLAQAWLAVKNTTVETIDRQATAAQKPFGVFLELEAPAGASDGIAPSLLKSLIDGVVCAFQNHLDQSTVGEMAARIANAIGENPDDVAAHLLSDERAVLGSQHRLVYARDNGVQWNPADHLCVAGQLLRRTSDRWRLNGTICTMEPRTATDASN